MNIRRFLASSLSLFLCLQKSKRILSVSFDQADKTVQLTSSACKSYLLSAMVFMLASVAEGFRLSECNVKITLEHFIIEAFPSLALTFIGDCIYTIFIAAK